MANHLLESLFFTTSELLHRIPLQPPPGPAQLLLPPFHIRLELYGLYKQATDSSSFVAVPRHGSAIQRQRWESWSRCTSLEPSESVILYLSTLYPFFFRWTNLPTRTLNWYLSNLTLTEKNNVEILLKELKALVSDLESVPEIMAEVNLVPAENSIGDETNSEFSFEDLTLSDSRHLRGQSYSSNGETSYLSEHNTPSPVIDVHTRRRSYSSISACSIEHVPTVPFTPNIGPTGRGSRRASVASIPLLVSRRPSQAISKVNDPPNLVRRPSVSQGAQIPSLLRDETSALLQSTSHRIGQSMTLVRQSLQRLEKLEEKVDCALHHKLSTPSTPQSTSYPSISPDLKPLDLSLTGWITQMCHTLLH